MSIGGPHSGDNNYDNECNRIGSGQFAGATVGDPKQ